MRFDMLQLYSFTIAKVNSASAKGWPFEGQLSSEVAQAENQLNRKHWRKPTLCPIGTRFAMSVTSMFGGALC